MDINSIKVLDTAKLTILHPVTKKPTDMIVEIKSSASKDFRKAQIAFNKVNTKEDITEDERTENLYSMYASLVASWSGVQDGKKDLPMTIENVMSIFKKQYWFFVQIFSFINKEANFLEVTETN